MEAEEEVRVQVNVDRLRQKRVKIDEEDEVTRVGNLMEKMLSDGYLQ